MKDQSDSVTEEIRSTAGSGYHFSDQRAGNQEVRAVYYSFALFVYGFLAIVALIAAFNIINSIGMGTSARMRQYGAMRAIGTSVRQLKSMVVAETSAYVIRGLLTGLGAGLPLHHFLYQRIITSRWGDAWNLPVSEFCVIAMVMIGAAAAAVAGPIRRISGMSVVKTISVQ
ncbi:MAG: ABC transporter permease [Lachnospiraceae bacterium]|nr:ABC transporter permease [Lachnospiraceae bacterium]